MSKSALISAHIRYGLEGSGQQASFPAWEQAYSIGAIFSDQQSQIVVGGKTHTVARRKQETQILYVSGVDHVDFSSPRHGVETLLTQAFLNEVSNDLEVARVTSLGRGVQHVVDDGPLRTLALQIYPYFDRPDELDALRADHFLWALGVYVATRYGDLSSKRKKPGQLTTWQTRMAKDLIEYHLVDGISLAKLAELCGLRVSQFSRAFKRSCGLAPYQWLQQRRIVKAKALLCKSSYSLAEISGICGYADQSHFTRAFGRSEGLSPRSWQLLRTA
ncbi:MAG: AraC family transcriptional regulator [Hyphomonadaceae bacterium]